MADSVVLRPRRGRPHRDAKGWIFVGPFLAVFALTFLAPIGYAIYLSLFREQASSAAPRSSGWATTPTSCPTPSSGSRSAGCCCSWSSRCR